MFEPEDFASTIRELRGERTQKACAEVAGISRSTWNQYEQAKTTPKRNYAALARGLGVTEDDLTEAIIAAWRERTGREEDLVPTLIHSPQGVLIVALGPGSVLLSTPPFLEVTAFDV